MIDVFPGDLVIIEAGNPVVSVVDVYEEYDETEARFSKHEFLYIKSKSYFNNEGPVGTPDALFFVLAVSNVLPKDWKAVQTQERAVFIVSLLNGRKVWITEGHLKKVPKKSVQ